MLRLLAGWVERLKIGTERGHTHSSDVLRHIKPVRANVGHAARRAAGLCLNTPVPVRVIEQPVLGVRALDDEDFA